jgi:dTDP-4-amino-4,6-dideoxygalactose transaminase
MLREHGSKKKYYHPIEGYNGRLDALQAGFLNQKLAFLQSWNFERRQHAKYYNQALSSIKDVTTPFEPDWSRANYHLYIIKATWRDQLQEYLTEQGIGTGLHYPLPLHLQEAYRVLLYKENDFPVAEAAAKQILSLPMFPTLKLEQQGRVVEEIRKFYSTKHKGM